MATGNHQSGNSAAPRRHGETVGRFGPQQGRDRPRSRLAEDTGPFYSEQSLRRWLNLSGEELERLIADGRMLTCLTSDNLRVFPVWQFDDEGHLLGGIQEVIGLFRSAGLPDGWTVAKWLNVSNPELSHEKGSGLLARGEVTVVVEAARRSVWRMMQ